MTDPASLIQQQLASPLPAPVWLVQTFKTLGFALHAVLMSLWYAGLPSALVLRFLGSEPARFQGRRLIRQMPVIIALGINLGIVPLLFLQLAYYKAFYSATILVAWFWLAIVVLLLPAYYGVYAYAWQERGAGRGLISLRATAAWAAAVLLLVIGFLFAHGFSLMDHVERWPKLWQAHSIAGAALGTALNFGDPTLWPRWLLMFGLALETTAAWLVFDAFWLSKRRDNPEQTQWTWRFARRLYTLGMLWFVAAGSWYVFGSWTEELRRTMFRWPFWPLTLLAAISAGLPWLLIMTAERRPYKRLLSALIALGQIGVLLANAVSRQAVQNVNLKPYWDVFAQTTAIQWGPILLFLVTLCIGAVVVAWMLVQLKRRPALG